jgi:hypothetical protein
VEKTGDPRWVWRVIATCADENIALPPWARAYLIEVAKGIETAKGDIGRELRNILKFPQKKSGRRRRVELDMKDEQLAVAFMREILAGVSPGKARQQVIEVSGGDDKDLKARLKSFFGLKSLPTRDQQWQWKLIVSTWLLNHPHYVERYPDLPKTFYFR